MPNIVEQQDLLKGLPDTRLALLMQNPVATIPPFLVAAEAQRRQAIRQQFAGSGDNESVVDSLTKQLASVPQNIQATPQPMPQVPPMPPMAGVAALQQAQQGMAAGGPVRRFAEQGYVAPQFRGRAGAQGYLPGEQPEDGIMSRVYNYVTPGITTLLTNLQTVGINPNAEQKKQLDLQNNIMEPPPEAAYVDPFVAAGRPAERGVRPEMAPKPTIPPDPNVGKEDTSDENRSKLEALFADRGLSDMEKAQKWFAMANEFYDPSLTTGQSIARAGLAFTEAAGNQAQAERELSRAREEALLKYDIGKQEEARAIAEQRREAEAAALKAKTDIATGQLDDFYRQQREIAQRVQSIEDAEAEGKLTDPVAAQRMKDTLVSQMAEIGRKIGAYEKFISSTYGFNTIPVVDTEKNTISFPGI